MLEAPVPYIEVLSRLEDDSKTLDELHQKKFSDFLAKQNVGSLFELVHSYTPSLQFELLGFRISSYQLMLRSSHLIFAEGVTQLKRDLSNVDKEVMHNVIARHLSEIQNKLKDKIAAQAVLDELKISKEDIRKHIRYSTGITKFNYMVQLVNLNEHTSRMKAKFETWEAKNLKFNRYQSLLAQYFDIMYSFEQRGKSLKRYAQYLKQFDKLLDEIPRNSEIAIDSDDVWDDLTDAVSCLSLEEGSIGESEESVDPFAGINDLFVPGFDSSRSTPSSSSSSSSAPRISVTRSKYSNKTNRL